MTPGEGQGALEMKERQLLKCDMVSSGPVHSVNETSRSMLLRLIDKMPNNLYLREREMFSLPRLLGKKETILSKQIEQAISLRNVFHSLFCLPCYPPPHTPHPSNTPLLFWEAVNIANLFLLGKD